MEDPLNVFQYPPKFPLHLLTVLHNKIGKLVSEIPETHLPSYLRVKIGAFNSLGKSGKSMQFVKKTVI